METEARIRIADWQHERETLLRIRFAVFVHEQGVPPELEEDGQDPSALHLLADLPAMGPVATVRLLPNGHIGRMAVLAGQRGHGIGSALLERLIDIGRERRIGALFLNAQCAAEGFYRRYGFQPEGAVFDDAGIPHRHMRLPLDG